MPWNKYTRSGGLMFILSLLIVAFSSPTMESRPYLLAVALLGGVAGFLTCLKGIEYDEQEDDTLF